MHLSYIHTHTHTNTRTHGIFNVLKHLHELQQLQIVLYIYHIYADILYVFHVYIFVQIYT